MTTENKPQLGITDLQNVVKVIDVAAERGAFKGNELSAVGSIRDKIAGFLEQVSSANEPVPSETTEEVATSEESITDVSSDVSTTRRKSKKTV
jgi:hypothetical protein